MRHLAKVKVRTENVFSWRKDDEQCSMCLSIALRISRITKSKLADLAQFLYLKISVLSGQKVSKILGKNISICYLSKMTILWAKNLLRASAKLEIWHTSKLGHAQKNSIHSKKWDLKYTNICINIFFVS